jgi:DNA-binding LacI/PurR family transcriptional regulator/DNA-binding transcriptional regulator YhcF (GntR family)
MTDMRTAELPQYAQIKRRLIDEIRSGQWTVGGTFPSEAELVARYRVSRSTLVRSLQELVRDGYLYRRQGQGTFVADYRHRQEQLSRIPLFVHSPSTSSSIRANQLMLKILAGMESALGAGLPGVIIRQVPEGPLDDATRQLISSLKPRVALMVEPSFTPELMYALRAQGCTIWSLNEPNDDANSVYIDQERAGYMATKFLIDQGRRKIALLNGPKSDYWGFAAKLRGYQRALHDAGIEFDERCVREGQHAIDSEAGRAMLRSLLADGVEVDGVVGVSDLKAMGAVAMAQELGRKVPDDLLVIGIDNTFAAHADPPLPAVSMPFEEVGRQAAMRAREFLDKPDSSDSVVALQQIRLQPTIEPRMS